MQPGLLTLLLGLHAIVGVAQLDAIFPHLLHEDPLGFPDFAVSDTSGGRLCAAALFLPRSGDVGPGVIHASRAGGNVSSF